MAQAQPFVWGGGGQQLSYDQAKKRREAADKLATNDKVPETFGAGLSRIGEALLARSYGEQATAAETAGADSRKAVVDALLSNADPSMADIGGALSNDWVANDPGSSAIVQALLGQELQQNDPLRQQQLAMGEIELANAQKPAGPEYGFIELGDGTIVRTDKTSGGVEDVGQFGTPPAPDAPEVKTIFDPATGREQTVQWNGAEWMPIGGVAAPKTGQTINVGGASPTPGDDKFYEAMGAESGKRFAALITQGSTARRNLSQLAVAGDLLETVPEGPMGVATLFAGKFGIDLGGLDETQALNAVVEQMVPAQREPGSGPMSDKDIEMYRGSVVSLSNMRGGNRLIIETAKAINEYDLQIAEIAGKVEDGLITRAEARAEMAAVPNPIDAFREARKRLEEQGEPVAPQSPPANQSTPADIDDILKGYGL